MQKQLNVVDYSGKSFVVFGELTRDYKDSLKGLGGKFNRYLKVREGFAGGPGWIFTINHSPSVMDFVNKVNNGEISPTDLPSNNGDGIPVVNTTSSQTYQWVKFRIFKPEKGMKVALKVNGQEVKGEVLSTKVHNNIVDNVFIDFNGKTSMAVIQNSKWKLLGYMVEHTLFFSEN